ncbi:MAG: PqqD family peptide modification chaperone, partial [Acidobacteria bacterium]|nr:PqqD family peptide modification chaperone [Acidobacteriota bacterium]
PSLALCGEFSSAHGAVLANCRSRLHHSLAHLRWLPWQACRAACEDLARKLRDHLGTELSAVRFEAVPRGGYLVLGMLAQIMDLSPDQLGAGPGKQGAPVVLVDDCALSGARLKQVLGRLQDSRVVFAHLASHPDLRAEALAREPRLEACLSAIDLEQPGAAEEEASCSLDLEAWGGALDGEGRYWLGRLEHLCFPWKEPDQPVLDPAEGRFVPGWSVIPDEYCLRASGEKVSRIPLHLCRDSESAVRLAAGVVYLDQGDGVVLANLERGGSLRLSGSAASFWRALIESGDPEAAQQRLVRHYAVAPATCRRDLERTLEALEEQGFLEPARVRP